jgi:outer membrane phospholipase A
MVPTEEEAPTPAAAAPADDTQQPPADNTQQPPPLKNLRLPTVQRPQEPVETTPVPGQVAPTAPDPGKQIELKYVPGYRIVLSGHRENYFITGLTAAQHLVKFQYSAKFDLWPNASRHSAYVSFTQKSLWRLFDSSAPFEESNYSPEIFYGYYTRFGDVAPQPGRTTFFLDNARIGLEHESNGLDGTRSRGWNRFYGLARGGMYLGSDHYLLATPRMWLPPFDDDDNKDIAQYLGYGSLGLEYGYDPEKRTWLGGGNISVTMWKGWNTDLDRGAVEIALQWRPGYEGRFVEWWKFTPYVYAQAHLGYGDTLLNYNHSAKIVRIGFAFEDRVNWVTLPKH